MEPASVSGTGASGVLLISMAGGRTLSVYGEINFLNPTGINIRFHEINVILLILLDRFLMGILLGR